MKAVVKKPFAALLVFAFRQFPLPIQRLCARHLRSQLRVRFMTILWAQLDEEHRVRFLDEHRDEVLRFLKEKDGV